MNQTIFIYQLLALLFLYNFDFKINNFEYISSKYFPYCA